MCLGIPCQVDEVLADQPQLAWVDVGGARRKVSTALLDGEDVQPGDWVLVHVGFALSKLDEEEAQATLELLEGMNKAYEDELAALARSDIG
ncbi:MAG: HypC/HybG/HupF family hydrogenase formation chaperone [Acidimicrobiales bacterium]